MRMGKSRNCEGHETNPFKFLLELVTPSYVRLLWPAKGVLQEGLASIYFIATSAREE